MSKVLICGVPKDGFWRCKKFWPHDGEIVDTAKFTEADMKRLAEEPLLVIKPYSEPEAVEDIKHIFEQLGEDDFTKQGRPKVAAVAKLLGHDVSAEELEEAWEAYTKSQDSEEG